MARWDGDRGVWRVAVEAKQPGGKRRRIVRDIKQPNTRAGSKAVALEEARLRLEVARAAELEWPGLNGDETTFAATAWAWVDRSRGDWSPKTLKETRYSLRRYILPALGSTPLDKVTPRQIEKLYGDWAADGYSASTRRRWHGMVRSIFSEAERLGDLHGPNPMVRVKPAGGKAPERRIPSAEDVRRVIAEARSPLMALCFELAASTGARRGTLVALRWRDVDLDDRTISCVQAVSRGCDGVVLKGNKADKAYAVGIAGSVVDALAEQRRRASETAMALGLASSFGDLFIFSGDGGQTPWNESSLSHGWRIACEAAGVKCRLHDVRHFAATRLLAAGVPLRVVADRLGCTEGNVIKTYSHRVPTPEDGRAAEVLAAALSG
jgi:integrase